MTFKQLVLEPGIGRKPIFSSQKVKKDFAPIPDLKSKQFSDKLSGSSIKVTKRIAVKLALNKLIFLVKLVKNPKVWREPNRPATLSKAETESK